MKRVLLFICIIFGLGAARADTTAVRRTVSSLGADIGAGYLFPSSGLERSDIVNGGPWLRSAVSVHAKYQMSFTAATRLGRLYPGARQGVGVSYTTFGDRRTTGSPVSVYLFQGAPVHRFSDRVSLGYEWNFGASFGWHRYSFAIGPESNVQVGSRVNAVMNLGLLLDWRVTRHFTLRAGVEGTHYSNGNTSHPNPGVNTVGARVGIVYTPSPGDIAGSGVADADREFRGISFDLLFYGAPHKEMVVIESGVEKPAPGRFAVAGVNFAPMWGFNRFFRAGIGLDLRYNEGANLTKYYIPGTAAEGMKFYRQPFSDRAMAGLSLRAELTMPIFAINVGIGRNLLAIKANRHTYQQLHLKIGVWRGTWLNVGYQLHDFHRPDNLMLGLGYTFRR